MTEKKELSNEEINAILEGISNDTFRAFLESSKKYTMEHVESGIINDKTFSIMFTALLNGFIANSIDWQIKSLKSIYNASVKEKPYMTYFLNMVEKDWNTMIDKRKKH